MSYNFPLCCSCEFDAGPRSDSYRRKTIVIFALNLLQQGRGASNLTRLVKESVVPKEQEESSPSRITECLDSFRYSNDSNDNERSSTGKTRSPIDSNPMTQGAGGQGSLLITSSLDLLLSHMLYCEGG